MVLGQLVFGQEGRAYVSNNPNGPGLSIRWAGPEISYQEGVKIYRQSGRKGWELITASPIMPPSSIPGDLALSNNEQGMVQTLIEEDHKTFVDGFSGILIFMESLKSYRLALAMRIAYNDLTAEQGKKYRYKVEATLKGKAVLLGETEEIKCGDFAPLPPPTNIMVERKRKRSFIWWDNDEKHYFTYNVYVKGPSDSDFKLHTQEIGSAVIADKKDKFIQLRTHKDSLYLIKIEALDYFGEKALVSEEIEIEVVDMDPPVAPQLLVKAEARDKKLTISWVKPEEADLAGYNLYRKHEEVDSVYTQVNKKLISPSDTSFIDKVREPGVYNYQLECFDETGNVSKSLPEFGEVEDIIPPPVPQFVSLKADTGLFVIRWQPVRASDLRGYLVLRSVADENNEDNVFMPASEILDSNYFAEPIAPNVRSPYVYIVRSVDTLLNYSANSDGVIGQLPDVTPPAKPFVKAVEEVDGGLRIVWMENVEKDLKGYHVYKRIQGDTNSFSKLNGLMVPSDISAYTDKEAVRGESCEYQVVAVDFAGLESPVSNTAKGKMENLALSGELAISRQKFNPSRKEFSLSWNGSDLVNEPIVGYAVFRSVDGGKALQRGKVSSEVQFKEKLSKPGIYEYHVRVYGERGNILRSELIEIQVEKE